MSSALFGPTPLNDGPEWEPDSSYDGGGVVHEDYTPWHGTVDDLTELAGKMRAAHGVPLPPLPLVEQAASTLMTLLEGYAANKGREAVSRKMATNELDNLRGVARALRLFSEDQGEDFAEARRRLSIEWDLYSGQDQTDLSIPYEAKKSGESYAGATDLFFVLGNFETLVEHTIKQYDHLDESKLVPTQFITALADVYDSLFPKHAKAKLAFVDFWGRWLTGSGVSYDSLYNATKRRRRPSPNAK